MSKSLIDAKIEAASYHAGLSDKDRRRIQMDWMNDKTKVVCATTAFGMGIDKPDVRFVLHHSLPQSIDGYYQECGRAGRDGLKAVCILYYNFADMMRWVKWIESIDLDPLIKKTRIENVRNITNYCENIIDCRRFTQMAYFGENFGREQCLRDRNTACDNCLNKNGDEHHTIMKDVTDESNQIIEAVRDVCHEKSQNVTLIEFVKFLLGKKNTRDFNSKHFGSLKKWSNSNVERLIHKLILENYVEERLHTVINEPNRIGNGVKAVHKNQSK